ncbi:MAG: TIGR01212 family radical SAM protein [Bacteroidaceae bacterium]|nr:TIGR01212 family radical SAM protein [Bacteroidaceae bacterium]
MQRYNEYGSWLTAQLGVKAQKISLNAGFTCPNRDGRVGTGGCTYCNNQTFNPDYCAPTKSITQQLEEGKAFFSRKYPEMKYLAYFQAYTNTYDSLENLKAKYEEALRVPGVVGLVIGTRPDCMPDSLLDYLEELHRSSFLLVEYGVESVYDKTLLRIHRGHSHAQTVDAIRRTAERGIPVGAHIILGLPGESREEMLEEADTLSRLPLTMLKLHQLQLIKGTQMAAEYAAVPEDFHLFSADEYVDLVIDFLERLRPDLVLERFVSQSPASLLARPGWELKNHEFVAKVKRRLQERDARQGRLFQLSSSVGAN